MAGCIWHRSMIEKRELRRIRNEIRRVLREWDPIGVKDEPQAKDESDVYVGGISIFVKKNASETELSAHLWRVIEERFEVHPKSGATEESVKALRRIPEVAKLT